MPTPKQDAILSSVISLGLAAIMFGVVGFVDNDCPGGDPAKKEKAKQWYGIFGGVGLASGLYFAYSAYKK